MNLPLNGMLRIRPALLVCVYTFLFLHVGSPARAQDHGLPVHHHGHHPEHVETADDTTHQHHAPDGPSASVDGPMPYAALTPRAIKALSPDEMESLLAGRGMGMALPAELNGYPGPLHVLELEEVLNLSAEQSAQTRAVFQRMQTQAAVLGRQIVERERALDAAFAGGTIDEETLERFVVEIGLLRARLRMIHLQAHLDLYPVLTEEQRALYDAARGYANG